MPRCVCLGFRVETHALCPTRKGDHQHPAVAANSTNQIVRGKTPPTAGTDAPVQPHLVALDVSAGEKRLTRLTTNHVASQVQDAPSLFHQLIHAWVAAMHRFALHQAAKQPSTQTTRQSIGEVANDQTHNNQHSTSNSQELVVTLLAPGW